MVCRSKCSSQLTLGSTCGHVNVIVSSTVVADVFQAARQCLDQICVEGTSILDDSQLQSSLRRHPISNHLCGVVATVDSHDAVVFAALQVGEELLASASGKLLFESM